MNKIDKVIKKEVSDLVSTGKTIIRQASTARSAIGGDDLATISSWVTRIGNLVLKLYGKESQQYQNYKMALNTQNFYNIHSNWYDGIAQVQGIVLSVEHDVENNLLNNIRTLLQADIFADFLEMGEYLLKEGYKDASAVIIGAVLEDSLRKLCKKHGLPTLKENGSPLTMDPLNNSLAKEDVYSKLVQKQITTWAHIRNKAAHGQYDEYEKQQVEMMLLFVQNFAEQYL